MDSNIGSVGFVVAAFEVLSEVFELVVEELGVGGLLGRVLSVVSSLSNIINILFSGVFLCLEFSQFTPSLHAFAVLHLFFLIDCP